MPTVVGVRLRFSKTLWFDPAGTEPVEGDIVIVETERGTELGLVSRGVQEVEQSDLVSPLKPVLRIADEAELREAAEMTLKEREALKGFRALIEHYRLDMKPVGVEFMLGGDKAVFYFSADERVDFRELVKDLASTHQMRIDMRQVGVRDEARMVGGIGHCGQMLCCVRFGGEFQPVSIRMAKEQDLPLNPLKISGLCGRLMCCLRYEFDAYKDFKSRAPKRGAIVSTDRGDAKVADLNTPRELVRLRFEGGENVIVPLSGMSCGKGGTCPCHVDQDVLTAAGAKEAPVARAERPVRELKTDSEPASKDATVRKRRRRKSGGGGDEGAATAQPKSEAPRRTAGRGGQGKQDGERAAQPKQVAGQEGQTEQDSADKPSRSGRRRRRRRSSGSKGTGTAES